MEAMDRLSTCVDFMPLRRAKVLKRISIRINRCIKFVGRYPTEAPKSVFRASPIRIFLAKHIYA